jgi:hypothetical protein
MAWIHCYSCGSDEQVFCSFFMDNKAKLELVSNEGALCSVEGVPQG